MQFSIFNLSVNADNLCISCTQFPVRLHNSGYSIFPQIQTIHTYNVHNFPWNSRNSDLQFFYKSTQSVDIMYTISRGTYAILDIQFFFKSKQSMQIVLLNLCISECSIFLQIQKSLHLLYAISC